MIRYITKYTHVLKVTLAFCLTLALSIFDCKAQEEEIHFGKLSSENGLSQITVSAIFQDSKGFLWFGTRDGLNRYDGYSFEVFRNIDGDDKSICNNNISSITEDPFGFIWIGTENGLSRYDYSSNKFLNFSRSSDSTGLSHQKVSSLLSDKKGRLWIGTEEGLDCFDYESSCFSKESFGGMLSYNRIIDIEEDSYGNLWIGALHSGLIRYNPETGVHDVFSHDPGDRKSISHNQVREIYEDSKRNLWIGTRNGLNLFNPKDQSFFHFGEDIYPGKKLSNEAVRCIIEDKENNLYIGTNEGLNILSTSNGEMKIYNPGKHVIGNLNHFFIYSIYIDNAETVWLGTFFGGVNYFNTFNQQFKYQNPAHTENFIFGSIGPMAETPDKIWIGTGGGGLSSYNKSNGIYKRFNLDFPKSSFVSNVVKALHIEGDTIFLTTENNKLVYFSIKNENIIKSFQFTSNGFIQNIYPDNKGKLLLCVRDTFGLRRFDPKLGTHEVLTYKSANNQEMLFPFTTCILNESPGIRWVGTRYTGLYRHDLTNNSTNRYVVNPSDPGALKSNHITNIILDSRNNIWVGTEEGGLSLFNRENNNFTSFGIKDGLPGRNIFGIMEDQNSFLWISTLSGVSKFDPVEKSFTNYLYGNGFPLQELSENSYLKLFDNRMAFGGNNGFVTFDPQKVTSNTYVPPVVITEFRLLHANNKDYHTLHKRFITDNDKVRLKYNQSGFMIQYTALNYIFPENNQYAYMMEGFDNEWNYVGKQRMTTYTNLRKGNYTFKVKASNNDGLWNENFVSLDIKILPPPWLTWYAYLLYLALFLLLALMFFKQLSLEHQIRIKQVEQEQMEKVHQLRIRMFTNFSHELRTPLTLINGPIEDLLKRKDLSNSVHNTLTMVQKNARRLLLIVNQLMDFRKQESGKMQLKATESNFVDYIKEISLAFHELARKQNIDFILKTSRHDITFWFDPQLLEKVFFNILSNAFKNTSQGGKIEISVDKKTRKDFNSKTPALSSYFSQTVANKFIEITIADTGVGIPENDLEKIFDPFYQVDNHKQVASPGTGIGLSLSKGIIELHSGLIIVESKPNKGARFTVILPAGKEHLKPDEIILDYKNGESPGHYLVPEGSFFPDEEEVVRVQTSSYTLLIIEDNPEVRKYINQSLKPYYNILEADNGEEGYSLALNHIPELIISDIMMPGMNGLELCSKLKSDIHTSHIPIILLTAMATFRQIKEGFEVGSDDYITKPFNAEILKMKVDSLIANRERMRKAFEKKFPFEQTRGESTSVDDEFLEKVYTVLENHISDSEFNIDIFSKEIGMSRANLYRKIKALSNLAPNDLIKNYRLKTSTKLLEEKRYSISEISYKVGFSTPAYFTNSFKKAFGISPTQYIEKNFPPLKS